MVPIGRQQWRERCWQLAERRRDSADLAAWQTTIGAAAASARILAAVCLLLAVHRIRRLSSDGRATHS